MNAERQEVLLTSAAFGQGFLENVKATKFVTITKVLRVLHAVRQVGIPLSYNQFNILTAEILVDRLIARDLHFLASQIRPFRAVHSVTNLVRVRLPWLEE